MRMLTWRGWLAAILAGMVAAALTFWVLFTVRRLLIEEAQLQQIVQLIQTGRIRVEPQPAQTPPTEPHR